MRCLARLGVSLLLLLVHGCETDDCVFRSPDGPCADAVGDGGSEDGGPPSDAEPLDAGARADVGVASDAGPVDSGSLLSDAAPGDGGPEGDASDAGPSTSMWPAGPLAGPIEAGDLVGLRAEVRELPGGGFGPPVVTSNNPEVFESDGLLYGTARASAVRGGERFPLQGDIGVYVHHINRAPSPRYVSVFVENASAEAVTVTGFGSGYSQGETGGLGIGASPDYRVSEDWINGSYNTVLGATTLGPGAGVVLFQRRLEFNWEVDGRFQIAASGDVVLSVVASESPRASAVRAAAESDAEGVLAGIPGPGIFGREAGTYQHSEWRSTIVADVPSAVGGTRRLGFMVNTANGAGFSQNQAFPALSHFSDSARESVGMYGNVYRFVIRLRHGETPAEEKRVRISFASLSLSSAPSRLWDGVGRFNGLAQPVLNTPSRRVDVLGEVVLAPEGERTVMFEAMVPGLTSIPQAIYLESI